MPDFLQIASAMREQMHATLSRSDVLKPLAWLVLILAGSFVAVAYSTQPAWLVVSAFVAMLLSVALYSYSFLFCLHKDRDALRSEKYSLHKMAIEHGLYGDNVTGLIEPDTPPSSGKLLDASKGAPATPESGP